MSSAAAMGESPGIWHTTPGKYSGRAGQGERGRPQVYQERRNASLLTFVASCRSTEDLSRLPKVFVRVSGRPSCSHGKGDYNVSTLTKAIGG